MPQSIGERKVGMRKGKEEAREIRRQGEKREVKAEKRDIVIAITYSSNYYKIKWQ